MGEHNGVQVRVGRLHRLDAWEAELMRPVLVEPGSRARAVAVAVNHLGNGWLFGTITVTVALLGGASGWRFVRIAAVALAVAFSAYAFLKRHIARVRPCHADASLDACVKPLDLYSCPSGHTMTASIFAVALTGLFPVAVPAAIVMFGLVAWSRISLGHHYPSDVIFGALIGTVITVPLSLWLS